MSAELSALHYPTHENLRDWIATYRPEERPGGTILVVDDENGPRQALRMLLSGEFVVHLASDVPSALRILEQETIHLIVTDIRMPQQSGVDLLRLIKESSRKSR